MYEVVNQQDTIIAIIREAESRKKAIAQWRLTIFMEKLDFHFPEGSWSVRRVEEDSWIRWDYPLSESTKVPNVYLLAVPLEV